ncbi:hypothetical protein HELRODRAFT_129646, partial [Helobdella robusta]|uniref:Fibronectin type-III domain-containing protein n=1 Tax=Helobdella robusta TaxID=6412 RepID=T1EHR9_HELRO
PSAPQKLHVKDTGKDFITVEWLAPQFDGGAKVFYYIVEKKDVSRMGGDWGTAAKLRSADTECKVSNLIQGNAYLFRVMAENQTGIGPATELNHPVVAKPPFDLQVLDYSVDHVTLRWIAPEFNGGSPITNYIIEKRDIHFNLWTTVGKTEVTQFRVTNVFDGQTYFFRVSAENICGRGVQAETDKPVTAK